MGVDAEPGDKRLLRVGLGLLWLFDALLQAEPVHFRAAYWLDEFAQSSMAEPASVNALVLYVARRIAEHPLVDNAVFVLIEAVLGVALLCRWRVRTTLLASVVFALAVWVAGEGLGELPTGFALIAFGAPGSALLYAVLGLLAWPAPRRTPAALPAEGGSSAQGARAVGAEASGGPSRWALGVWCALWVGGAALYLERAHPLRLLLRANLEEAGVGNRAWLVDLDRRVSALVTPHATAVAAALIALDLLVGLGVLVRRTRRAALVVGIALSALFWVVGQDLGGVLSAGATDPDTAPLVVLLALVLLGFGSARRRPASPDASAPGPSRSARPEGQCGAGRPDRAPAGQVG